MDLDRNPSKKTTPKINSDQQTMENYGSQKETWDRSWDVWKIAFRAVENGGRIHLFHDKDTAELLP